MKLFFVFAFSITFHLCFSQTYFSEIRQLKFENYRNMEGKISSQNRENREHHVLVNLAQPIKFIRTNSGFHPSPIVEYYFSVPDSIVRRIHLEFDSTNYLPQTYNAMIGYKENIERLTEFNNQYDIIRKELVLILGEPKVTKNLKEKDNTWTRKDKWENDSLSAESYLVFSVVGGRGNRIRVNINYNYKSNAQPNWQSPTSTKVNSKQDSIAKVYLSLIFRKDYKASWGFIGEELKKQLTYENYVKAITPISDLKKKKKDELILFMNGVKNGQLGQMPFYSYKWLSDKSTPPQVLFYIGFKNEESMEILGVSPKSRKKGKITKLNY